MKKKILITKSNYSKPAIIDAFKNPTLSNAKMREEVKSELSSSCFVNGNKSVVDIDKLEEVLLSDDDISFVDLMATRSTGVQQFTTPEERYAFIEAIGVQDVGYLLPQNMIQKISKAMGIKVSRPTIANRRECRDLVCDYLTVNTSDIYEAVEVAHDKGVKGLPTQLELNLVENICKNIKKSKSKKLKAKDIVILCDPKLSDPVLKAELKKVDPDLTRPYPGTSMRPDIIVFYTEDGERKMLLHEFYGWKGSDKYYAEQTTKMANAINETGSAIFVAFSDRLENKLRACNENESPLYEAVWNWNLGQAFFAPDEVSATYKALNSMLNYIGARSVMPAPNKAYFK